VVAGVIFVALLVGPLRRLRHGVERLAAGDLAVRVPPTSRDEVGELTRAFNEMGDSLQQKQRVQNAFGRYVNDYVLNQLLEGPEEEGRGGIEREVTILFADIRGFTHLSEGLKAHKVVALLNEIFQLVSDKILERGGTIDKFIGDSVMAYFGAPVTQPDHALRALSAAIAIQQAVEARTRAIRQPGGAASEALPVEIGIGIHTGVVVVGNIGSDRRTDFTAVGDAVNVAHRLEKLARPGEILVSEAVQRVVRAAARLRFEGERQLSGREEPVHVYSVEIDGRGASAEPRSPLSA
jgi:class 3 adenylate cyclase